MDGVTMIYDQRTELTRCVYAGVMLLVAECGEQPAEDFAREYRDRTTVTTHVASCKHPYIIADPE